MAEVAEQTEPLAARLTDIVIVPGPPTERAGFVAPVIQDRSVLCTAREQVNQPRPSTQRLTFWSVLIENVHVFSYPGTDTVG